MNALRKITRWVFIVLVPVLLLSGTIAWAFNSLWIYRDGFIKYDVSQALGVSEPQLEKSAAELIAYFNNPGQKYLDINVTYDNGETAPLYDQADILHMHDVKGVLWLDYTLALISLVYCLVYISGAFIWNKRDGRKDLATGAKRGGVATVGLLVFLGIFAVTSFDWFFTTFHEIFFPQGNWEFPYGDHMITLFPDGFWSDVTLLVGLVALGLALVVWSAGFISLRRMKKHEASLSPPE